MATGSLHEIRSSTPQPWLDPGAAALSARDRELLALLARGRSTGQIAAASAVSTNTVRTRIRRVQRKLAVYDRNQVARVARGLGLA